MGKVLDEIRQAINDSGQTRYAISKATGISQAQLSRLKTGKSGLSIETLERLEDYLNLEIVLGPKRPRRTKRSK